MKIKTSKPNRRDISVQLMDDVIVAFNNVGVGELEDGSRIEELMKGDPSISLVEDYMTEPSGEEIHENPEVEGDIIEAEVSEPEVEDNAADNDSDVLDPESEVEELDMDDLKVSELQELCSDAGLEKKEWKDLKKAELIKYIEENTEES